MLPVRIIRKFKTFISGAVGGKLDSCQDRRPEMVEGCEATIFTKTSLTVLISFSSDLPREILFDQSPWTGMMVGTDSVEITGLS